MAPVSDIPAPGAAPRGAYAKTPERRHQILTAAAAEFGSRGYRGGSLRSIARDLDVSLAVLQHHFGSKDALLIAVLEHADRQRAEWFDDTARSFGVAAAAVANARLNLDRPEMLRLLATLAAEATAPDHPAHSWFTERYVRLSVLLATLIESDERCAAARGRSSAEDLSRRLIATWDGLQLQWLLDPSFDLADSLERALIEMLHR